MVAETQGKGSVALARCTGRYTESEHCPAQAAPFPPPTSAPLSSRTWEQQPHGHLSELQTVRCLPAQRLPPHPPSPSVALQSAVVAAGLAANYSHGGKLQSSHWRQTTVIPLAANYSHPTGGKLQSSRARTHMSKNAARAGAPRNCSARPQSRPRVPCGVGDTLEFGSCGSGVNCAVQQQ